MSQSSLSESWNIALAEAITAGRQCFPLLTAADNIELQLRQIKKNEFAGDFSASSRRDYYDADDHTLFYSRSTP